MQYFLLKVSIKRMFSAGWTGAAVATVCRLGLHAKREVLQNVSSLHRSQVAPCLDADRYLQSELRRCPSPC